MMGPVSATALLPVALDADGDLALVTGASLLPVALDADGDGALPNAERRKGDLLLERLAARLA